MVWAVQAVGRLDVHLPAVVVGEHDQAAGDGVPAREGVEDLVDRRFGVQGARERLANLQQRRQALVLGLTAIRERWFGSRAWSSCGCHAYDKNVIKRITHGNPILTRRPAAVKLERLDNGKVYQHSQCPGPADRQTCRLNLFLWTKMFEMGRM